MNEPTIRIGELARRLGRQPVTVRRWERMGRIPPARRERSSRYRAWTEAEAAEIARRWGGVEPTREGQR